MLNEPQFTELCLRNFASKFIMIHDAVGSTISLLYMVDLPVKFIIFNHVRDCQAPQCHFKNRGALNSPNSPFNHCGLESRSCGALKVGLIQCQLGKAF